MVKLHLNGREYVCKTTTDAAKLVDMMGQLATPIESMYVDDDVRKAMELKGYYLPYASKIAFQITEMEDPDQIYASHDEARATVERVKAVLAEAAGTPAEDGE